MNQEIKEIIIQELLKRVEEIRRLEIKDRLAYLGFLIQDISGIPAVYLSVKDAQDILEVVGEKVRLGKNDFM